MAKIRILQTTTLGAIRFAKGDVIDIGVDSARHLIALGKAEIVPEKVVSGDDTDHPAVPAKAKRK